MKAEGESALPKLRAAGYSEEFIASLSGSAARQAARSAYSAFNRTIGEGALVWDFEGQNERLRAQEALALVAAANQRAAEAQLAKLQDELSMRAARDAVSVERFQRTHDLNALNQNCAQCHK